MLKIWLGVILVGLGLFYQDGLDQAKKENKDFAVFFTAPWCPYCQKLEKEVFPILEKEGDFKNIILVKVDVSTPSNMQKMMVSSKIPQMIIFRRVGKSWGKRDSKIGYDSVENYREFLKD